MGRGLSRLALAAVFSGAVSDALRGQERESPIDTTRPRPELQQRCYRGRPIHLCRTFLFLEFTATGRVAATKSYESKGLFAGEVGWMGNANQSLAFGVGLFGQHGPMLGGLGFRPRLRWWLDETRSFDFGPGWIFDGNASRQPFNAPAFSGILAYTMHDYAAIVAQLMVRDPERGDVDKSTRALFLLGARGHPPFKTLLWIGYGVLAYILIAVIANYEGGGY